MLQLGQGYFPMPILWIGGSVTSKEEVLDLLEGAGLPVNPASMIGRKFRLDSPGRAREMYSDIIGIEIRDGSVELMVGNGTVVLKKVVQDTGTKVRFLWYKLYYRLPLKDRGGSDNPIRPSIFDRITLL